LRSSAAAAAQVAHLHGGALHALEGEEESRLHGDGGFSSGEEMASREPERFEFGGGGLENSCGLRSNGERKTALSGGTFGILLFHFLQN